MARAQGARAQMALAFETTYGTPPAGGFTKMPFASTTLGAEQPLLNSELLGYGRDPLAPIKDAVTADGDVVVPLDAEAFGFWLKAAFGAPTTTGTGPWTHEFRSGAWTLPSLSIETGMPEVPRYAMYSGCVLDQITWQMQRSGLLTATARLVAQGETVGTTTSAGTPAALELKRFGHFNGSITRNGSALGNVVSADITYANNLDRIETIRSDGRIDGADPSIAALTGSIEVRFADSTLVTQAINGDPCELEFAYVLPSGESFTFTVHAVYLPRPRIEISGPQGVQATFDWQAARDGVVGRMCTATIQRAYLEATYLFWGEATNNPLSSVYGGRMVDVPECAAWTWDARPYPFFPELTDVWTDGPNWRLGHWLTGRLGSVSLAALVRHLCLRAGLPGTRIDVTGLWGAVEGYAIGALESPRASITTLARHFGFDAVETEGVIRFVMRGRAAVASVTPDDLVAAREGDVLELTRGQETELPQALKWQVARADEDYEAAQVEARRITVDTTRIASESFPMAVPPEEAERRCRRALMEAWTGRESAVFRLPTSRLALDPADVVTLAHDGRSIPMRLISIADADARGIEAVRQDREAYDLPPGAPRPSALSQAVVFGAPDAVLLDLPQLTEDQSAHRPFVAAHAVPWPGGMAVYRSPSTDGFDLLTTSQSRARIGTLVSDFYAGPTSRFDLGNMLVIDLLTGTLESVTDLTLFGGANALAIESASGVWEIVQAGAAELIAPGRYRLTRLLRGQRGTEGAIGNPVSAGARVVVLDTALASLPIAEADLGIPWNWRIGPASRPVSDETYVAQTFTPEGAGLRPFSVAHVEQPWRKPRTPGDLTIRWTRRSRSLSADSWSGLEVPLAEELEAYEVEILEGATVKRTLNTVTTSAVYIAAAQTADWGVLLGPGDTLDIRIYQLSALVGRGAPKTVTLTF